MNVSTLQLKALLNDVCIEIDKLHRQCEFNRDKDAVLSMRGESYGMAIVAKMIEQEINNSKNS
tara:strand:+ start:362 stop:550 length:189 start_codon:yes stop_codon:yes gene_type:complete